MPTTSKQDQDQADIAKIISTINKSMERTIISNILDVKALAKTIGECRADTDSVALNTITGGGIPYGYITGYVGHESSGKTSFALMQAGVETRKGKHVAFVDIEGGFKTQQSIEYIERFGIVLSNFHLVVPKYKEEAIDVVEALIVSKKFSLVIYDSIAADLASRQLEREASDKGVGIEAKMNTMLFKKVKSSLQPINLNDETDKPWCAFLYINQLRDVIGMAKGPVPSAPKGSGGWAVKHLTDILIEYKRSNYLGPNGEEINTTSSETKSENDMIYGQTIKLMVRKNKTWFPFIVTTVDYYFKDTPDGLIKQNGIDHGKEIYTLANLYNTFDKCGTIVFFDIEVIKHLTLESVTKDGKNPIFDKEAVTKIVNNYADLNPEAKLKLIENVMNLQYPLYTKDGLNITKIDNPTQLKAAFIKNGNLNVMCRYTKAGSIKEISQILATNAVVREKEIAKIYDLAINKKKTELLFDKEVQKAVMEEEKAEELEKVAYEQNGQITETSGSNSLFAKKE